MFPRAPGGSAGACPHSRPAYAEPTAPVPIGQGAARLRRNLRSGTKHGRRFKGWPTDRGGGGRVRRQPASLPFIDIFLLFTPPFRTCVRHSVTSLDGGALSDKVSGSDSASSDTTTPPSSSGQPGLLCFDARPKKAPRYERGQRTHWTEVGLRRKLGPKTESIFERKRCLKWDKNLQL
jgi:hypothetical protein